MMKEIKSILSSIVTLLESGGEIASAAYIEKTLKGSNEVIEDFLISNELWGGSGSIADQALIGHNELRKNLEEALVSLGEKQQHIGMLNSRTEAWLLSFRGSNGQ